MRQNSEEMTTEPDEIIKRMDRLVADTSPGREGTVPLNGIAEPIARNHRNAIRRGMSTDDIEG
ncbi:transcription regulator [Halorhabdus utahensis DSM 12940]|uniref:Transcription regulator n=2 Tax=Halorhabdus utahensis TaxID=146826 RepID=C7NPP7_HALUD|nr:transcription regulator [Halorhabdus utahensis DSM 12940]